MKDAQRETRHAARTLNGEEVRRETETNRERAEVRGKKEEVRRRKKKREEGC